MKKKIVLFVLLMILFIPVYAKEDKYKIVSGDIETLDSEICFDTECFYVIGNDGNVLRLLSKYNITVEDNPVQSADAGGIAFTDKPYWGETGYQDAKYVYNSNSNLYKYVEAYKDSIIEKGVVVENARLVNQEELYLGGIDIITYTWHTAKVRFNSNFWSGVAYDDSYVWTSELEQAGYTNSYFGISPVLEIPVGWFSSEMNVYVGGTNFVKASDGVISNNTATVDLTFNDLEQEVKYQTIIYNDTNKEMYVNDIDVKNLSEKFISVKLDSKSENMMIEPGGSSLISFYVKTLKEEGAGRNLDDDVTISFRVSDKNFNPGTFSNLMEMIILIIVFGGTLYFIKNKKINALVLVGIVSLFSVHYVYADDFIDVKLKGKIKFESQNKIISSGTVLNGKNADYSNSKEVWAYYDKVKNVEVKSLMNKPKEYFKEFDLTENKTGRVKAYLIENGDKDTPYDLVIMSNGVVVANNDSSFMFSFPNTEKVDGLSNVDFRGATTMQGMFIGNEKLVSVDTKSIEMNNTTNTSFMFYQCNEIEHDRDDFNLENVNNDDYMIPHSLYNTVKKDAVDDTVEMSNGRNITTGKFIKNETINDEFPIYYYRGDIKNNNVVFGGFCWKIVRTTDTGGTKLIYNGKVKSDGSCQMTTDEEISIGSESFNNWYSSINAMGYMKGTNNIRDKVSSTSMSYSISFNSDWSASNEFYYASEFEYKNGKYYLINPKKYKWLESYDEINGFYRCGYNATSCTSLQYVYGTSSKIFVINLENGESLDNKYIYISKEYTQRDNNYILDKPIKKSFIEWIDNYESFVGYYMCENSKETQCENMMKINLSNSYSINGFKFKKNIYGSSAIYKDGLYTLQDVYVGNIWDDDRKKVLSKYQYTCGGETSCTNVNFIFSGTSTGYSYYELTDGMLFDELYEEIFESNSVDSNVKAFIDLWYEKNMINYTKTLEDTIWCNDRSFYSGGIKGKKLDFTEIRSSTDYRVENNLIQLNCPNKNDAFTVNEKNGNGKLTYPVALLTVDELMLAGMDNENDVNIYLRTDNYGFWTMSSNYWGSSSGYFGSSNYISNEDIDAGYLIRPSISLKNSLKYVTGNGTVEKPYVIE